MDKHSDTQLYFLMDLFVLWPWYCDASNLIKVQRELIRRLLTRMEHRIRINSLPKQRVRIRMRPKIGYPQVMVT